MYKFFSSFPFSGHAAAFYFSALSNNHLDIWLSFIFYLGRIWFRSPCVVHPYHFFSFCCRGARQFYFNNFLLFVGAYVLFLCLCGSRSEYFRIVALVIILWLFPFSVTCTCMWWCQLYKSNVHPIFPLSRKGITWWLFCRRLTRRPHEGCYFCLRIENRAHKTHIFANGTWGLCWGGVGWGGVGVLTFCLVRTIHISRLPRSLECLPRYMLLGCWELWNACRDLLWYPCYVTCCYAAEISGMLGTLHVATLPGALECLPRYMLLRCRDLLWYPCYVTCCYAAESSGMLATLHVATLQRSPVVSLLRYMLLRCRELWNACHVTCCYAAEISCGILATLHVATLPRSLECLPRYMLLRCRDLWNAWHVTCCYAAESSGMLATLHVATLQRSPVVSLLRYMLLRCRELWNACHVTCCYAAEISCGILATLHVAALPRALECLPRYMLLRCRDLLWYPCYVTCYYAAEISGMLATLHVATLPRSLECLARYMLLRCRELWNACHVTWCRCLAWKSQYWAFDVQAHGYR